MSVDESRDSLAEDRTLLQLSAAGDERAFRSIVRAHAPAVAAIVTSMLGPGDDADDAGQESFIRLMRALPTFRGDSSIRTFVTRIAMNVSLDALARRKRQFKFVSLGSTEDTESARVASSEGSLDDEMAKRARAALVQQAVDSLDGKHRAVVVMRLLEERSTRESAQLLGIPEGTVMSRLTRAMQKLENILRPVLER